MIQICKALLLAAAMLGVSLLAIFDIIPESYAQWAPLALLALFPTAWIGTSKKCGATQ